MQLLRCLTFHRSSDQKFSCEPNCRAEMIHETSSLIHSRRKLSDDIKVRCWRNLCVGGAHVGGNLSRDSRILWRLSFVHRAVINGSACRFLLLRRPQRWIREIQTFCFCGGGQRGILGGKSLSAGKIFEKKKIEERKEEVRPLFIQLSGQVDVTGWQRRWEQSAEDPGDWCQSTIGGTHFRVCCCCVMSTMTQFSAIFSLTGHATIAWSCTQPIYRTNNNGGRIITQLPLPSIINPILLAWFIQRSIWNLAQFRSLCTMLNRRWWWWLKRLASTQRTSLFSLISLAGSVVLGGKTGFLFFSPPLHSCRGQSTPKEEE